MTLRLKCEQGWPGRKLRKDISSRRRKCTWSGVSEAWSREEQCLGPEHEGLWMQRRTVCAFLMQVNSNLLKVLKVVLLWPNLQFKMIALWCRGWAAGGEPSYGAVGLEAMIVKWDMVGAGQWRRGWIWEQHRRYIWHDFLSTDIRDVTVFGSVKCLILLKSLSPFFNEILLSLPLSAVT